MKNYMPRFLLILTVPLWLSACISGQPRVDGGAPVIEAGGTLPTSQAPGEVQVYPLQTIEQAPEVRELGSGSGTDMQSPAVPQTRLALRATPAVQGLMQDASRKLQTGQLVEAVAIVERALRIEPRNGQLWSMLAQIRSRQKQYALAESLALKSNSLASGDVDLQRNNWLLIAHARRLNGDVNGARKAEQKASLLASQIGG